MSLLTADNVIVFAFGIVGLLAIALLLRAAAGLDRQWRRRRVRCPELGRTAECLVEQDMRSGRWVDVRECSLLPKGEPVACDKACLKLMERAISAAVPAPH